MTVQPARTRQVRKAVIPVAGFGTRFLPATKAMPKEMLPIVDKPVIQYIVEEAVAAGLDEVIFVTGRGKRALEDHFDSSFELECLLRDKGKLAALKEVREIAELVRVVYVRQKEALGLGHAILQAEKVVGSEPFALLLGDEVIDTTSTGGAAAQPVIGQLLQAYAQHGRSMVAVRRCPTETISNYGVVDPAATPRSARQLDVRRVVEKPSADEAPSDLAITGRYILSPQVFTYLHEIKPGAGGEIQLTDALQQLAAHPDEGLTALEYQGRYYDAGSKLGFIEATIDYALKRPELAHHLRRFLSERTR